MGTRVQKRARIEVEGRCYSGPKSAEFWNRVATLDDADRHALYASGVLLQNMEATLLIWLANAEQSAKQRKAQEARQTARALKKRKR